MSNFVTKSNVKSTTGVDTSDFTEKADLPGLKSDIGDLDNGRLKTTPQDLSKLSNVVNNGFVKRKSMTN